MLHLAMLMTFLIELSMGQFQENNGVPLHMEQAMALQRPNSSVASTELVEYNDISESFVGSIGKLSNFRSISLYLQSRKVYA